MRDLCVGVCPRASPRPSYSAKLSSTPSGVCVSSRPFLSASSPFHFLSRLSQSCLLRLRPPCSAWRRVLGFFSFAPQPPFRARAGRVPELFRPFFPVDGNTSFSHLSFHRLLDRPRTIARGGMATDLAKGFGRLAECTVANIWCRGGEEGKDGEDHRTDAWCASIRFDAVLGQGAILHCKLQPASHVLKGDKEAEFCPLGFVCPSALR